jgi:predicted Zn-dependent peptidase
VTARSAVALTTVLFAAGFASVALIAQGPVRPDRSKPPALGPAPSLTLPQIQKHTLSNGLPVWLVEAHEVPLVQVNLVVLTGSSDDPAGKFGTASLTAAMLDEGAGKMNALELADAIDVLGADLSTGGGFDSSAVRLNVPVARLGDALPLMADVALRPTFPQKEFERLRQETVTNLLQARDDPASVAPMSFARIVFGAMHRYGTGAAGTGASLKALTVADLQAFHAAMYQPSNATLVAVGDFRANTILPQLEKHFGSWKRGTATSRTPVPAASQLSAREITIVDMPRAQQSQIRIGWVGVARSTPDYFPLQVLNTVLGGSFTSRLNQNLRERNGYSYGASSRFEMRLAPGAFVAGAGVQTDKTAEALREFFNELQAIRKPVPAEELAKAKNYIALGLPSEFETMGDLSSHLEEMIVYHLPDDYFSRYVGSIQAVTVEAVSRAAATYIQPDKFAVVVVGDRSVIEPGIKALGLGPVRVVTVNEVLGQ